MKFPLLLTLLAPLALAANKPFLIPSLLTHQPGGISNGGTNYYRIAFTVTSTNSGKTTSGYCNTFWGDNSDSIKPLVPYSLNVPEGEWFPCDSSEGAYDEASPFAMKLFPYFSIGNFSVEVREKVGSSSLYGYYKVNNETDVECDLNYNGAHVGGDCSIPDGEGPITLQTFKSEKDWME